MDTWVKFEGIPLNLSLSVLEKLGLRQGQTVDYATVARITSETSLEFAAELRHRKSLGDDVPDPAGLEKAVASLAVMAEEEEADRKLLSEAEKLLSEAERRFLSEIKATGQILTYFGTNDGSSGFLVAPLPPESE